MGCGRTGQLLPASISADGKTLIGVRFRAPVDVAPDGSRFLMTAFAEAGNPFQLRVVVNWFEELRRLAPAQ